MSRTRIHTVTEDVKLSAELNPGHSENHSTGHGKGAEKTMVRWVNIDDDMARQRIDNFLLTYLKGLPKSLIYRILRKGEVRVNKGRIKPSYRLKSGDILRIPPVVVPPKNSPPKPSYSLQNQLQAAILYENEHMLVVNKPSGLAVHGGSGVQLGLIESLRQMRSTVPFLELVHRLDRDTSGCVMIAKSRRGLRHLQQQLREGRIDKIYNALVAGRWPKRRRYVNVPLIKNQLASGERMVRVVEPGSAGAKESLTEYRVLDTYSGSTLVEAKPITGRTHQIRVHSLYAGHPILGDGKYGDKTLSAYLSQIALKRLFLHAAALRFHAFTGNRVTVEAPMSTELIGVLDKLSEIKNS